MKFSSKLATSHITKITELFTVLLIADCLIRLSEQLLSHNSQTLACGRVLLPQPIIIKFEILSYSALFFPGVIIIYFPGCLLIRFVGEIQYN